MDLLKDIFYVNKRTAKKTFRLLVDNWSIILTGLVYYGINIALMLIISLLLGVPVIGILGGILTAIVISAIVSDYFYLLNNIIRYGKFTLNDFKEGFKVYLWKIYGIFFIAWIASFLFNRFFSLLFFNLPYSGWLVSIISLLIMILLNSLPEAIYQKHYSPWETIVYAVEFIRENWIEWFIPNIVLGTVFYLTTGKLLLNLFSIYRGIGIDFSLSGVLVYILGQVMLSFIMIYRGVLFDILSTSTRRKRMFMRDFYN